MMPELSPYYRQMTLVLGLMTLLGCGLHSPEVVFVVPDDFRGLLKLRGNVPDGQEARRVGNEIVLTFPADGELRIKQKNPIFDWHRKRARSYSGQEIPVRSLAREEPPDEFGLYSLGEHQETIVEEKPDGITRIGVHVNETWHFIGTRREARARHREKLGLAVDED